MAYLTPGFNPTKLTFGIVWVLLSSMPFLTKAAAQTKQEVKFVQPSPGQGSPPPPPKKLGRPPLCIEPPPPLSSTALVPASVSTVLPKNEKRELIWGKTTQKRPTFWFYIPYSASSIRSLKFSLRDIAGKTITPDVYLSSPTEPGVIGISSPTAPPLVKGWYQGYLFVDLNCSSSGTSKDGVAAWIFYEELSNSLSQDFNRAQTQLEQASFYAQNGFWYDALTTVIELRRKNQDNGSWNRLLKSVGLQTFDDKKIIKCCTPKVKRSP